MALKLRARWLAAGLGTACSLLLSAAAIGVLAGCTPPPRRIPYVPPDLPDWSSTYRSPKGLRLHVFVSTGTVKPPGGVLGGTWTARIPLSVPSFLVEHPSAGLILVGTGLAPALSDSAQAHLGWLLGVISEPAVDEGQDIVSQLKAAGFDPGKVRRVILPDCRFPQTGQIDAFPDAEVTVASAERRWALRSGPAAAVRPQDVRAVRRWDSVDLADAEALGTVPHAVDLLGDDSIWLLGLPGYTPGTVAVLVRLASGPVVLAGGAAPRARSLRAPSVPAVATDPDEWWESVWRLKRFRELNEGVVVVPGFEASVLEDGDRQDIRVYAAKDSDEEKTESGPGRRPTPQPGFPLPVPPSTPPPMGR